MNYKELCESLFAELNCAFSFWFSELRDIDRYLQNCSQEMKELTKDISYGISEWDKELTNIKCDLDNNQDNIQILKLLYNKLCDLKNKMSLSQITENGLIKREDPYGSALEGFKTQLECEIEGAENPETIINVQIEQENQHYQVLESLRKQLEDKVKYVENLKVIIDNQVVQDSQCDQVLKDLGAQLEYEERKLQDLKQFITDNNKMLDKLAEEIREKESEKGRLTHEIEKINNQLRKQEKEIAAEGEYSKKLDEEILNVKDVLKKLKTKTSLMQRQLENQKEQNIEKEEILIGLKQKEENWLKALEDQVAMQHESNILEIESDSDSEVKELTFIQSKVISQSNSIDQLKLILKPLQDELNEPQEGISQDESSYWEDDMQCLQDNTVSLTTQEMSDKEVQTLNIHKSHNRDTVFFTIPFALTGVSLTVIPLIKSTENDTIFLSVGLSFSVLAIVCLVTVTLYSYYRESVANLELPKKLSGNSTDNIITQDCNMDQGLN
ncbi:MAG: hypothetical protein U0X86_001252 [Wolbachia endosymbiont of Xenopsylla cheopis]